MSEMKDFNFTEPADVFTAKRRGSKRSPPIYQRFATGADALRFICESVPVEDLSGLIVETDVGRFSAADVRALYNGPDYPLVRAVVVME